MWPQHDRPLVILAPMDGYTNPPFRRFVKRVEPRALVFSEFLPAKMIAGNAKLADKLFKIYPDEEPVVIQLYGKDAQDFKSAAILAEERGAAGIDINMGCPAKKVVAHQHGSALMKDIDRSRAIIGEIKSAVSVPVSVKTRLGWEDHRNLIPFSLQLQEEGLDAITIHGRTYRQKFEGLANWEPIYELKQALSIPVFGNGDINGPDRARLCLGNLDGVMVGRAATADPWVMQGIADLFDGQEPRTMPGFVEKAPLWKTYAALCMEYGTDEYRGACAFRKFLVKMVRELGLSMETRRQATSVGSLADIEAVLDLFVEESKRQIAA